MRHQSFGLMRTYKLFLICLLFIFSAKTSLAVYTVHKAYKLDLSNNAILCMYQDNNGYMWFGTYDGLNLYNGKSMFVYRFEMDNKNSLCSNIIHKISQADEDNLWISTFLGLNKFSLKERKVTESHTECPEARLLASDSKGNTWVISKKNYISYYTPKVKKFRDIHLPGVSTENVIELFTDNDGKLYLIMTDGSIKNIKISNKSSNDLELDVSDTKFHDKSIISAFYQSNEMYFVDNERKLHLFNPSQKTKIFLADLSKLPNNGRISNILSFNDNLFISFNSGAIIKLDIQKDSYEEITSSGVGIYCTIKDKKQDLLWIGTDGQGVQLYHQSHEMFKNITHEYLPIKTQKPIRSIYTDEYDNLWIGTKGDGFLQIKNYNDINAHPLYNRYTTDNGLSNNSVFCFLRSKFYNVIWIGTEGPGLSFYSYRDNKVKTLSSEQIGKVHSICEVNSSTLWLATAGNGLLEVSLKEENGTLSVKSVNEFFPKKGDRICNEFHSMYYDGKSTIFVGSRGGYGVVRFNIENKQYDFIQMNKNENSAIGDVLSVHFSKDSIFYIGASSGLTKMQLLPNGNNQIKQFDRRSGIANDMIHGILEDEDGCIWLSTNKGLTKYNPHNDFFHNYSHPELLVTEFSDDAYWKSPQTNRLFFGGINGLVWVDPNEDYPASSYAPELLFFDLKISGESHTLDNYMNKEGSVEIPSNTSSFTISFVALDYINGDNYEYSYILEDYNTTWTELQKTNEVTFTNLPYGDYVLKVRYKNDVFGSDEKYYSLHISKLAPWYLTKWAILGYILLFLFICTYIIYLIRKKIINKQILIARKIKEEQKEKLLEAKLNFFTNITHEFCTPLTVINGVTEHIDKTLETNDLRKYTDVLRNNVNDLNELIQEILDFRKIEESKFEAGNIKKVSISDIMTRHLESFIPIAEQNNVELNASIPKNLEWNTDISCFNRIFINLISNAFKYTKEGGKVNVSVDIENEKLILKVRNTGKGIEESKIPNIFDRYRILENMENNSLYSQMTSRNGIGLSICHSMVKLLQGEIEVKSEIDQFAEFIVYLPVLEATKQTNPEIQQRENSGNGVDTLSPKRPEDASKQTILIVDDNKDIVWLITDILSDRYIIRGANTVEEALKILEMQTPALIITDIMMPNIDGLEFINRIKANKFTKHIPLIIISAKISDKEQAEGLNTGADAYLTKPFSPIVLQSLVNRLLITKEELKDYYYSPESAYEYTDGQLIHQEDKDFMDSVISIIDENIEEENLRPELIADKLGINTRNLYRRFKKITSLPPNDFIKDYRFTLAARLLVTTSLTIQEIIYKVGITNKSYFYREFFKKYNMTPKEYRSADSASKPQ